MNSINVVSEHGLCSACGVCISVCPKNAISFKKEKTYYAVASEKCINCGICTDICSATETNISKLFSDNNFDIPESFVEGSAIAAYNLHAKDKELLLNSTSGGFISSTVKKLLDDRIYNCAFLVNGYDYSDILKAERITTYTASTAKSRYLSVSMEKLVKEMLDRRDEKIIICATPCAVQGILNVVNRFKLNRENYLILGLFCDNVQSYGINEYFSSFSNKEIEELFFRDKTLNGWPGDVKIVYKGGKAKYLNSSKRRDVKQFYKLKRCFTCFDKLNCFADISIGDNYTKKNHHSGGSNSIIIRTSRGASAFETVRHLFEVNDVDTDAILTSQSVGERYQNFINASVIEDNENIVIYEDLHIDYTPQDKDSLTEAIKRTECSMSVIKKDVRSKEFGRLIKRIKRKLHL